MLPRRTVLSVGVVAALALSGCGDRGSRSASRPPVVHIAEGDFHIKAPKRLPAGEVELSVDNKGPDDHEMIIVREGERHLPFRADGLTIDEDAVESSIAGALEPGEPGNRRLRVKLKPGRYVLMCNMAGHYLAGMDKDVEVR